LLNLGRTFSIAKEDWWLVCQRVDELMTHQTPSLTSCEKSLYIQCPKKCGGTTNLIFENLVQAKDHRRRPIFNKISRRMATFEDFLDQVDFFMV